MTVDWDEELRKLNAGELDVKLKRRDREIQELQRKAQEGDPAEWMKANARKAQRAAQESSYQVHFGGGSYPRETQQKELCLFWRRILLSACSTSEVTQWLLFPSITQGIVQGGLASVLSPNGGVGSQSLARGM